MKLRKQLSLSYIQMILIAIISVVTLCIFMILFFERYLMPRFAETELFDNDAFAVHELMNDFNAEHAENPEYIGKISEIFNSYGFHFKIEKNNNTLFSNLSFIEKEALESMDRMNTFNGTYPMIYQISGATMVQFPFSENGNDYLISSVSFSSLSLFGLGEHTITTIFLICITAVIALVAVAILISCMFFSNTIHKKISAPVNALNSAAERIKKSDYSKRIDYKGINEFENVCKTFNDMQQTIIQEIKEQENYEKRRNEVIAGISHDLKTPLTSIKGYVKGLKDGIASTPEKQAHYLDVIDEKADNMSYLIERLFLFSKLETSEMPLNLEIINVNDYLSEFIFSENEDLSENGVKIEFQTKCHDQKVLIDPIQINRVIGNVIDNSKKYNPIKDLKIKVNLFCENNNAVIIISDNGCGVSEEKLPKLFDSFYRGDESRTQGNKLGSGLGLAITKRIIELHSGSIIAFNDNGLSIKIELPLAEE